MTKKEQKELEELRVLTKLVSDYNVRLKVHLHEREALKREHDWLDKKLAKLIEKSEREDTESD